MIATGGALREDVERGPSLFRRTLLMGGFSGLLAVVFWPSLSEWYRLSQALGDASHLVVMPALSLVLLHWRRAEIFAGSQVDRRFAPLAVAGVIAAVVASLVPLAAWEPTDRTSLRIALIALTWIAGFGLIYGAGPVRQGLFALGVLLLMIPLPTAVLPRIVYFLQWGSAEGTAVAFGWTGTPFYREGFTFVLPGVAIEIAEECSGIRSSMALLMTSLMASHVSLSSSVGKALLVLMVVPLAIVKNCIRIVTLTLLSMHVDQGYLTGLLHRRGGIVFFLITLVLFGMIFLAVRSSESRMARSRAGRTDTKSLIQPEAAR